MGSEFGGCNAAHVHADTCMCWYMPVPCKGHACIFFQFWKLHSGTWPIIEGRPITVTNSIQPLDCDKDRYTVRISILLSACLVNSLREQQVPLTRLYKPLNVVLLLSYCLSCKSCRMAAACRNAFDAVHLHAAADMIS